MARVRLQDAVSARLLERLGVAAAETGLNGTTLGSALGVAAADLPAWAMRQEGVGELEKTHLKELSLLQSVVSIGTMEPARILAAIEEFGLKRQWIKVAGGEKAAVMETVIASQRPSQILEYGAYIGYTSMRMALHMRSWGGHVTTLEMDPVHVCITRNAVCLAGLDEHITVQIGHSDESVPIVCERHGRHFFDMVFMDQRSTRFHTDLATLERLQMLRPGCVVVADNVLKPGAPRWLWRVCAPGTGYISDVVSVREFASAETEDWMTVTYLPVGGSPLIPPEPKGMAALTARADRMRFKTVTRSFGNQKSELEDINHEFARTLEAMGIRRTKVVRTCFEGRGALSRVEGVDGAVGAFWAGEDRRLEMQGGAWAIDVAGATGAMLARPAAS